jgi:hypothetical protein
MSVPLRSTLSILRVEPSMLFAVEKEILVNSWFSPRGLRILPRAMVISTITIGEFVFFAGRIEEIA